jgi:PAS domain S-box-containing protein
MSEAENINASLKASDSLLYTSLDHLSQAAAVIDRGSSILYYNDTFRQLSAMSSEQLNRLDKGFSSFLEGIIQTEFLKKLQTADVWDTSVELNIPGNARLNCRLTLLPQFYAEGAINRFVVLLSKVNQFENDLLEILEKKNKQYELAIKGTKNGLWDWNLTSNEIYFSSQWFEMLGFAPDELPNRIETFYDLLHPEDYFHTIRQITAFIKQEMPNYDVEFRMKQKNGEFKWINSRGDIFLNKENQPCRFIGFNRDITERKIAEELVAAKEREYRTLINNLQEVIFKTDIYGQISFLNPFWETMTGYVMENCYGEEFINFLHPEEISKLRGSFKDLISGNQTLDISHLRMITRDGRVIWVELKARPLINEETRMAEGAYGSIKDVTERRKIQQALEESEKNQKEVLSSIDDAVWSFNVTKKEYFFFGNAIKMITGIDEMIFNQDPGIWLRIAHPEDRAEVRKAFQKLEKGNPEKEFVFRIMLDSGVIRYLRVRANVSYRDTTNEQRIDGTVADVTALKLAEKAVLDQEKAYRTLVNSLTETVFRFDRSGKITFVNPAFFALTELIEADVKNLSFFNLVHPEDLNHALEEWNNLRSMVSSVSNLELRIKNAKTGYRWISLSLQKSIESKEEFFGTITDIHDKKEATRQLIESEKKYRFLSENLNDILCLLDPSGYIEYISPSIKYLGFKSADFIGQPMSQLVSPAYAEEIKLQIRQLSRTKRETIVESEYLNFDGSSTPYETLFQPVLNKSGKLIQIQVSARDITERIKIRRALQDSEHRFKTIAESLPIPVIIIDNLSLKIKYANTALLEHYQYEAEEVLGKSLIRLFKFKSELKEQLLKVGQSPEINGLEYLSVNKAGQARWVSVFIRPIEFDNSACHIMVFYDISDRKNAEAMLKESEEKYRIISENISDLVFFHNTEGELIYVSPSTNELLGYQPSDWLGKIPYDLLHPEDEKTYLRSIEPAYLLQAEKLSNRFRFKNSKGEFIWFETIASPIFNSDAELIGVQTLSRNVMSFVHAEEEMQKALAKERELNELKSRFVSMASHEFRTPLTAIRSSIELLGIYTEKVDPEIQPKLTKHFDKIVRETKRLTSLMNDILILGRAEAGKTPFLPEKTNLENLCLEIIELFQQGQDDDCIEFHFKSTNKYFHLDPELITHVISNLVSNAIKYSKRSRKPILWIDEVDQYLIIRVTDFGIGIPKDEQERLFQSFFRARNATNIQGTGLGLVIVKQMVELHKGEIFVESELGEGSTFTVKIPNLKN